MVGFVSIVLLWGGHAGPVRAQVPHTLNYQGYLVASGTGTPVNATVAMTFKLYAAPSGIGAPLYTENQMVTVNNGVYSVIIGAVASLAALPFDTQYYLGVAVGGDTEMTPRQALIAAPYAVRSATTEALAAGATVAAGQLADHAVTQPKLSPVAGAAAGMVLGTDGSNLQWQSAGTGTVTSITAGAGLTGGMITGSGTIAIDPASAPLAGNYLKQNGNAFGGTAVAGTTDNNPLELWVNGARALQIQPNPNSPNLIGGFSGNAVDAGLNGATISGGGITGTNCGPSPVSDPKPCSNYVIGGFGAIGGGIANGSGSFAAVGGGDTNTALGAYSVIAGGHFNRVVQDYQYIVDHSTVGGGAFNEIKAGQFATIGGGSGNVIRDFSPTVWGDLATIGGGYNNAAKARDSTIGGGNSNIAYGRAGAIAGGFGNYAGGDYSAVGGGYQNNSGGLQGGAYSAVAGGYQNLANGSYSAITGGLNNVANGPESAVGGGNANVASGSWSTVPGGLSNNASGTVSFAAGWKANAQYNGCTVFADDSADNYTSCGGVNEFVVRALNGVYLFTGGNCDTTGGCGAGSTGYSGVYVGHGQGAWSVYSDRNVKDHIAPVDSRSVLEKLVAMPIATWRWKAEDQANRHMGPMAQDFRAAFGLGSDDTHISTVDADGVALAAIQGLYKILLDKDRKIKRLEARASEVDLLKRELAAIKSRLGLK